MKWFRLLGVVAAMWSISLPVPAQFNVFAWESFESGQLPATLMMRHDASPDNVQIVKYATISGIPGLFEGKAYEELSQYGLRFQTKPDKRFLSIMDHLTLDRQLLGAKGKALYQADIFIPADFKDFANVSVLAVVNQPEKKGALYQFYRFGILNVGKVFFSYANDTPQPLIYKQEDMESLKLERPGWHRFQIIFEGQSRIYCAVDGKITQFSPIEEPTLRFLNAGIFVAGTTESDLHCFVDNLSIQYTDQDVPLPDSPWLGAVTGTLLSSVAPPAETQQVTSVLPPPSPTGQVSAGPSQPSTPSPATVPSPGQGSFGTSAAPAAGLEWMTNPDEAWQRSVSMGKPLLVLFYAPRVRLFQDFQNLLQSNPQSQTFLSSFVLLQVDVNQLRGGTLAKQFNIFKVPTLVVLRNGAETSRYVMRNSSTWADIQASLK
ncbi:MAG: hypothetical protein Kow0059_10850 [Candidatus Sumerlaeia bacterium]